MPIFCAAENDGVGGSGAGAGCAGAGVVAAGAAAAAGAAVVTGSDFLQPAINNNANTTERTTRIWNFDFRIHASEFLVCLWLGKLSAKLEPSCICEGCDVFNWQKYQNA